MLLILAVYSGMDAKPKLPACGLIQRADPNRFDVLERAPITDAIFKREGEVVHVLIEAGADRRAREPNAQGCSVERIGLACWAYARAKLKIHLQ